MGLLIYISEQKRGIVPVRLPTRPSLRPGLNSSTQVAVLQVYAYTLIYTKKRLVNNFLFFYFLFPSRRPHILLRILLLMVALCRCSAASRISHRWTNDIWWHNRDNKYVGLGCTTIIGLQLININDGESIIYGV